jgi:radical SAM superfamily enzyme YgiQ (UPF0313 family)
LTRIIFIQPKVGYKGASFWDALGIGYIISYIKASGFSGEIEFYSGAFDSDDVIIKACSNADFVGFGFTSPQMKHALHLSRKIKRINPNCKTVFGGWHPTAVPEQTASNPEVDYVVVGEGEEGMLKIINGEVGKDERIVFSKPIGNLDELPFPDRKAIKVERHIQVAYRENGERITSIQGGRGCPFQCIFCSEYLMTKDLVRRRAPSKLVNEIEYVIDEYSVDLLKFVDPEINSSIQWVKDFYKEVIKRKVDVEFEANLHATLVDREMLELMKKANFRQIDIGVETGSPRMLKVIRKGTTIEQIKKVFKWSKEVGLLRRAYFMVGFPDETPEDVELTFKLAEELDPDVVGMTILCPFPGTTLYDSNLYKEVDWSKADEYRNDLYRTRKFSNEELRAIQDKFVKAFKNKLCYRLKS